MKFWAFISYSSRDRPWGDWLHRELENYRVPKLLVGRPTTRGAVVPPRLFPVFRDRDELPTDTDLGSQIRNALEQSRYLIVICSPNSARSKWVNEEILTFKRLGRANRILSVIVDGSPNATDTPGKDPALECYPSSLRFALGAEGQLTSERTHPISADAREHGDGKKNALLKLIAGVLGVNYDELAQRDLQRRVRRKRVLATLSASIAISLLLLTGWALRERQEAQARSYEAAIRGAHAAYQLRDYKAARELLQQRTASLDGWEASYLAGLLERSRPVRSALPEDWKAQRIKLVKRGENWRADPSAHPDLGLLNLKGAEPEFVGRMPASGRLFVITSQDDDRREFSWCDALGDKSEAAVSDRLYPALLLLGVFDLPGALDDPVVISEYGAWRINSASRAWESLFGETDGHFRITAWHLEPESRTMLLAVEQARSYNMRAVMPRSLVHRFRLDTDHSWKLTSSWMHTSGEIIALSALDAGYAFATEVVVGAHLGAGEDEQRVEMSYVGPNLVQLHTTASGIISRAKNGEVRSWPIRVAETNDDEVILQATQEGLFETIPMESYGSVHAGAWSPQGWLLVIGSEELNIFFALRVEPKSGSWMGQNLQLSSDATEPGLQFDSRPGVRVLRLAFSPSGDRIYGLVGSEELLDLETKDPRRIETYVVVWNAETGRQIALQSLVAERADKPPEGDESLANDGVIGFDAYAHRGPPRLKITEEKNGDILVADSQEGATPVRLVRMQSAVDGITTLDGSRLAKPVGDLVQVADAKSRRILLNLRMGNLNKHPDYLGWSPDGRHLVIVRIGNDPRHAGVFFLSASNP